MYRPGFVAAVRGAQSFASRGSGLRLAGRRTQTRSNARTRVAGRKRKGAKRVLLCAPPKWRSWSARFVDQVIQVIMFVWVLLAQVIN
jgi:hypothetical protein